MRELYFKSDFIDSNSEGQDKNLNYAHSILKKFLDWKFENIDYRTVPWIMNQAILYKDENIEIRLHDFSILKSDTYIHNHSNPFSSICLEWWYEEKLWKYEKNEEWDDEYFFEFKREKSWKIVEKSKREWKLVISNTRLHYPWNILSNPSNLFHTIWAKESLWNPLTLILKIKGNKKFEWKVFSKEQIITQPTDPIVKADSKDIEALKDRTNDWVKKFLEQTKYFNL